MYIQPWEWRLIRRVLDRTFSPQNTSFLLYFQIGPSSFEMHQSALVRQLSKDMIDWKCDICVVRKYRNPPYGHFLETLELCLMNREGSKIQGTVSNYLIGKFDAVIEEGDLVSITQLSVVNSLKVFPMSDAPYKLMFQKQTIVKSISHKTFPKTMFNFKRDDLLVLGSLVFCTEDNP